MSKIDLLAVAGMVISLLAFAVSISRAYLAKEAERELRRNLVKVILGPSAKRERDIEKNIKHSVWLYEHSIKDALDSLSGQSLDYSKVRSAETWIRLALPVRSKLKRARILEAVNQTSTRDRANYIAKVLGEALEDSKAGHTVEHIRLLRLGQ